MRIESLAKIIDGELLNFPSITYIDQVKINAKKVKRADAFICKNDKDIRNAIQNGAYAIISEINLQISDDEIAWIKVDSVEKAIIRYLRYKTIQLQSKFYLCDSVTYEILQSAVLSKDIIFLSNDIFDNFLKIVNANDNTIFISTDKKVLNDIYPAYLIVEDTDKNFVKIVKKMLFKIELIYQDTFYKDIYLPPVFIKQLNKAIKFSKKFSFDFSFENISLQSHFKPIFIDNSLNIKDFGQTGKVFVEERDKSNIKEEIIHLNKYAKYAKNILLIPEQYEEKYDTIETKIYTSFDDIIKYSKENYNFFLILNKEKKDIFTLLNHIKQKQEKRSLF